MNEVFRNVSIAADLITIIVAISGIYVGISKKTKNLTGYKINYYVSLILKVGVISFVFTLIFNIVQAIVMAMAKDGFISTPWNVLLYITVIAFGIFIFWLITPIVWTSSLVYAIEFINIFLPNNYKIDAQNFRNRVVFRIDRAVYGKDTNVVDVTDKLKQMVNNSKLEITASNALAGDPLPGIVKELVIDYKYNGKTKREIIKEKDTITLPN